MVSAGENEKGLFVSSGDLGLRALAKSSSLGSRGFDERGLDFETESKEFCFDCCRLT